MTTLTNTTWSELEIGAEAKLNRLCIADDLYVFANASGNLNPMHLPRHDGDGDGEPEAVAPSMWVGSLISAVLGNILPGPGTLYRSQSFKFLDRAHAGDKLTAHVRLIDKGPNRLARFDTWVVRQDGVRIAEGIAEVTAPDKRQSMDSADVPGLLVEQHVHFDRVLETAEPLPPIPTSVIAPEEANSLGGAILAAEHSIIEPILIGCKTKMMKTADELGADISRFEIIDLPSHDEAAARGVALVQDGTCRSVMKGYLHTDTLLHHVVKRDGGLRTTRRLSHVFVMDVPGLPNLLFVSDAAINISPDLETKVDITQNAIDLARSLGIETPKVGVLSAVENVNPKIPSTLDAAVLSKMADRGQIRGGIVDGPLAMDNAVDVDAAKTKGIKSMVAGRADVLIVPNLEAGNMVAKQLTFVARAEAGGIVIGARCPIILTSRADSDRARLASCAVAALYDRWVRS